MDKLETLIACLPNAPYKTLFAVEINALRAEIVILQSDNTRLTLELDEAGSNCSMYKQQVLMLTKEQEQGMNLYLATYKHLCEAQAREAKLREALELALDANGYGYDACRCAAALHTVQSAQQAIENALALPTDDTALMERLKEEREKCAKVCDKYKRGILDLVNVQELTRDIRSMT